MHSYLKKNIIYPILGALASYTPCLKASEIQECYNGYIITPPSSLPKPQTFSQELSSKLKIRSPRGPLLELNFSQNRLVDSPTMKELLKQLSSTPLRIKILDLSYTNVEKDVLLWSKNLLKKKSFRRLNIVGTPDSQAWEVFSEFLKQNASSYASKIIFLEENALAASRSAELFGAKIINNHLSYYQTAKTLLQAWQEAGFEGRSMGRVVHLLSHGSPEKNKRAKDFFGFKMQKALTQSTTLKKLETLKLDYLPLKSSFVETLFKNNIFHTLRSLSFKECGIKDEGVRILSHVELKNLVTLNLHANDLTDLALKYLKEREFNHLEDLDLSANDKITSEGLLSLSPENFPKLIHLSLSLIGNLDESSVNSLSKFSSLQTLNLFKCTLGNKGARAIANSHLNCLRNLNLAGNKIGSRGAHAFATELLLPKLSTLNLSENPEIDNEVKKALMDINHLRNIYF